MEEAVFRRSLAFLAAWRGGGGVQWGGVGWGGVGWGGVGWGGVVLVFTLCKCANCKYAKTTNENSQIGSAEGPLPWPR